jgi:hypothetical protein
MSDRYRNSSCLDALSRSPAEGEVIEVPLLLPGWQVKVLETAAHSRGLTAGAMVRTLLRDFISGLNPAGPPGSTERR